MARYADGLLADGEHIVLRTRQHWFAIVAYTIWFWVLAAIAALFFLLGRLISWAPLDWLALFGFIGAVVWVAWRYIGWSFQDYLVTNRRVMKVDGIINKEAADSSLEKINDAVLKQGLFARMLGYGDLEIMTAAEASVDVFKMLSRPTDFKKAMLNAKYSLEREMGGPMPSAPLRAPGPITPASPAATAPSAATVPYGGGSGGPVAGGPPPAAPTGAVPADAGSAARPMSSDEAAATLARLADLRDRGAISPADYEAKKAELLKRI